MKSKYIVTILLLLIGTTVFLNKREMLAVDQSKLPEKVEQSRGFQRWITNLKNKDIEVSADEFRLIEENEIYNTKWIRVYSVDEEGRETAFWEKIELAKELPKIAFAPSERAFIDFRPELRWQTDEFEGYKSNEVHFFGLRDDKIIDARIVDCSIAANCYFDRAYFLEESNDTFVVSEFSRNIDKKDETAPACSRDEVCTYTIKIHVIDLNKNSRLVYESDPMVLIINETIPDL